MIETLMVGAIIGTVFILAGALSFGIYQIPVVKKWWKKVGDVNESI
jgi:hypothetical protein